MNTKQKKFITVKRVQIVLVFLLVGFLSGSNGLMPFKIATAHAAQLSQTGKNEITTELLADSRTITSKAQLPTAVRDAVVQVASQDLNLPASRLTIIEAQPRTWKNGCLEVSNSNELCTQVLVNGWQVAVRASGKTLVYHTNDSGSVVKLNQKNRETSQNQLPTNDNDKIKPLPIPVSELPPPLDKNAIFQQISSGGFAGISDKIVLLNNGSLIHVNIRGSSDSPRQVRRISRSQVQQFQQLLKKEKFGEFVNQSYPASSGAADYKTYTLTSREGTVKYNDISLSRLPSGLQVIIKAWNDINQ